MNSSSKMGRSTVQTPPPVNKAAGMARAASIIATGNVASRILGLVRETVIASLFGATGLVSAFRVAQIIPTILYDLLVGGMVSSALVPVFSEQAERDRETLWHLASLVLSLAVIVLGLVVIIIELAAPFIFLILPGFSDELLVITIRLIRITTPAVFFLSLSGIITGLLYALRRFTLPAFTATAFNTAIVVVALVGVLGFNWGIEALAIGLLVGAFSQVALQLPGLRDARLRFVVDLYHPVLRRIGKLYLPIILGLVISGVAILLDRSFATLTGEQSIAWMQFATTIIQFPLGLISAAIALAILPTLSRLASVTETTTNAEISRSQHPQMRRHSASFSKLRKSSEDASLHTISVSETTNLDEFMNTLAAGLRLVLVLIIPATVALFIVAEPIVALLFERGNFTPFDTQQTALALRIYLLGLTFAAIDQPLVFAFYARQNTLIPALVGLLGVGFYLSAALLPTLIRPLQMTDLVLANSVQLTGHALVMLWLVNRVAPIRGRSLGPTTLKAIVAALVMGLALWWTLPLLQSWLPATNLVARATLVGVLIALGGSVYLLVLIPLKVQELTLLADLLRRFWPRRAN